MLLVACHTDPPGTGCLVTRHQFGDVWGSWHGCSAPCRSVAKQDWFLPAENSFWLKVRGKWSKKPLGYTREKVLRALLGSFTCCCWQQSPAGAGLQKQCEIAGDGTQNHADPCRVSPRGIYNPSGSQPCSGCIVSMVSALSFSAHPHPSAPGPRGRGDPHGAEILSFSCCWMEPQKGRGGGWLWGFCCPGVPKLLPTSLLRHFGS